MANSRRFLTCLTPMDTDRSDHPRPISSWLPKTTGTINAPGSDQLKTLLLDSGTISKQIAEVCLFVAVSERRVIVFVPTQTIASRLRFELNAIRSALKAGDLPRLQQVKLVVQPISAQPDQPPRRPEPELSESTIKQIRSTSDQISDPDLSAALSRLADSLISHSR